MSDWGPVVFWHWWILSGVLLILELSIPIFFFLWVGIAAAAVGFLMLLISGLSLQVQLACFGILSVIAVIACKYRKMHRSESEQPLFNQRGLHYQDRIFTLDHAISNGAGKVVVDDSTWQVRGPDLPAGTRVRVIGMDGIVFIVEPAD